ncbi:MAG: hypothetical protein KF795_10150 [Labilithrix sp.]|nr:hypothetical protein [Labilithrix sp.]
MLLETKMDANRKVGCTIGIEIDVDIQGPQRLLGIGGPDGYRLLELVGGTRRTNVEVTCGGCAFVATTLSFYDSETNQRWKMTVPKRQKSARQMWLYIGPKGARFKFRGAFTYNAHGRDRLDLVPPADWM